MLQVNIIAIYQTQSYRESLEYLGKHIQSESVFVSLTGIHDPLSGFTRRRKPEGEKSLTYGWD
jgi:hypothetical protein